MARRPTAAEVSELLTFLPAFSPGREVVVGATGGTTTADGALIWPHPVYADDVVAFFLRVGLAPWVETDYLSDRTRELATHPEALAEATFAEVRAVLTYCSRGERFTDGHWAEMVRRGVVRAALLRIGALFPPASASEHAENHLEP